VASNLEQLLSTEELADYLGVPTKTIYMWHYKGVGPRRLKVGKRTKYRASDISAWLDGRARG
jgi:excisionase family DNA binding protein